MSIAFSGNASNALAFFDLSGNDALRIDEFLFGVEFFISGNRLKDCLMLFQELDVNKDGQLDEAEFENFLTMLPNKALGKQKGAMELENNPGEDHYMQGGYNTYNKRPLDANEMLQLPQFSGSIRHKLEMRRRGKEVG